jgi:transcriptional regulator with PAS, ATPase and Fis domain
VTSINLVEQSIELDRSLVIPHKADFGSLIGTSNALLTLVEQAIQVAPGKTTVLVRGESGTGKELIAELIHRNSSRESGPFVKVNCAALPETLIEAELFGHERGAFTGASARRMGKFELADAGTIFLDEIVELTPATQGKLLRVLQEKSFHRVGGTIPIQVDVRIIAASNRPLDKLVAQGLFREDLFYRVRVFPIRIPALRERPEDIDPLIDWYLEHLPGELGKRSASLAPSARARLSAYEWPGNVRELRNCLERAIILAGDAPIEEKHLRLGPEPMQAESARDETLEEARERAVQAAERAWLRKALEKARGDRTAAAQAAGLTPRKLEAKLREHGLEAL